MTKRIVTCLLVAALSGCAHYNYYARKANADGQGHEALAYWSVTERAVWFDESSETVRVKMQCGKTVPFQERKGGVFVLYDGALWANPRTIEGAQYCGQVQGVAQVADLKAGDKLSLELWCDASTDDEGFSVPAPILGKGTHEFDVVQRSSEAPAAKPCSVPEPHSTR